jgi:hypothetical protein
MEDNKTQLTELQQLAVSQKRTRNALMLITGISVLSAFLFLIYALLRIPIPEPNRSAFDIIIGAVMGAVTTLVAYYFGSSKSSNDKNEIIKQKLG